MENKEFYINSKSEAMFQLLEINQDNYKGYIIALCKAVADYRIKWFEFDELYIEFKNHCRIMNIQYIPSI